jgi:protein-S-isoprenylcysteine O-methyltransferase Ste14
VAMDDHNRARDLQGLSALLVLLAVALIGLGLVRWRGQDWSALAWLAAHAVVYAIRIPHSLRSRKVAIAQSRADFSERIVLSSMTLAMMVLPLLYLATDIFAFADYALPHWAVFIGAAIPPPALWLFWRSHAELGRNWSPTLEVRDAHGLVTGGVYRRIRHPMYAAIALLALAQPLLLHNWVAGPPGLLAFALLWRLRLPREEAMMQDRFGADYDAYVAQTGRTLPKLARR